MERYSLGRKLSGRTLWSLFVILLRISFMTDCNSFAGPAILVSMSSSSGPINSLNSCMAFSYLVTFRMVWPASGCFPRRSNSPAIGWKMTEKWLAKPVPAVNSAAQVVRRKDSGKGYEEVYQGQISYSSIYEWIVVHTCHALTECFSVLNEFLRGLFQRSEMALIIVELRIGRLCASCKKLWVPNGQLMSFASLRGSPSLTLRHSNLACHREWRSVERHRSVGIFYHMDI